MATQICSNCGYEGSGKADPTRGDGAMGGLTKVLGMVAMLPVHSLWKMFRTKKGNICPNCGLNRMVKLSSDEGWIAQKKFEKELLLGQQKKKGGAQPIEEAPPPINMVEDKPAEPRAPRNVDPEAW